MGSRLELNLLGALEILRDSVPVSLRYEKLRALLAYLAVEQGRPHPREALVGLLWPEAIEADARRSLSQALFNLRQALGEGSTGPPPANPFLLSTRETLQFNPASDHRLDVAGFEALVQAAAAHSHGPSDLCAECVERLERAVTLYRGDFLSHFFVPDSSAFEDWALLRREGLRRQALAALAQLTTHFEQQAVYGRAVAYARRQLELEPYREEAHRDVMRLLALSGERSAALAQYEAARKALANELGVPPAPETEALLAQIKAGQWERRYPAPSPTPGGTRQDPASAPTGLPTPLTAFVGRERELAELARLLAAPECRLLTLTGPGGIGKTRLALQAAAQYHPGAVWVPLAPVQAPEQVVTAIADALGFTFQGNEPPVTQLARHLSAQSRLLLLDNFEHLLRPEAGPEWINDLLRGAPALKLLVTSRAALDLEGEWVFSVEGLGDRAVDLFIQSARRAQAGFELCEADVEPVRRIVRLVGAVPLAVELAAGWVRLLSCAEIADEIEQAFTTGHGLEVLTSQARDIPESHRSMAAVFEYSWRLLSAEERTALARLSVFRGGFGRAAAERVAGASLTVLSALSVKSLLRRVGAGRFDLHELVRQFAAGRLAETPDERVRANDAHCDFYARYLRERANDLRGARQRESAEEVALELDNVHAAWRWAVASARLPALTDLALPLYLFSQRRSRYAEGTALLTEAIMRLEGQSSAEAQEAVAGFVLGRGWLGIRLGRLEAAEADFQRFQAIYARLNRQPQGHMIGDPVMALGLIASIRGEYEAALRHYQAALEVIAQHGDHQALTYPHLYIASIQRALGNLAAAQRYAEQGHQLAQAAQQPWVLGFALNELGQVALACGDLAAAEGYLHEAYTLREKLGDASGMALDLSHLGSAALARQAPAEAAQFYERSLALYRQTGDQGGLVTALHGLGRTAMSTGDLPAAWPFLIQALAIAWRARFWPMTLSLLASLAELLADRGAVERARMVAAALLSQPPQERETRLRAEQLLTRLGADPRADTAVDLEPLINHLLLLPFVPD